MGITYTNCEDTEPHDEHPMGDRDDDMWCIGRDYPKWAPEKEG